MKDKIQKDNTILAIGQLKIEQTNIAKELGKTYERLEKEKAKIIQIFDATEKLKEKAKEWEQKRIDEQKGIELIKDSHKREIGRHKNNIKDVLFEKKTQIGKLEGLNFRIMNAEKRLEELEKLKEKEKEELIKIEELNKIKLELEKKIQLLRNDYNILGEKNSILKSSYNKKIKELKKWIIETEIKANRLKEEANQSEYRIKRFNDEYIRKNKDLQIYIKRAEIVYHKAFPKLKMNV